MCPAAGSSVQRFSFRAIDYQVGGTINPATVTLKNTNILNRSIQKVKQKVLSHSSHCTIFYSVIMGQTTWVVGEII